MSKKQLNTSQIQNELQGASAFFRPLEETAAPIVQEKPIVTRDSTREITPVRDLSRDMPREFPTRDEIQEFSFRLRDTLKVKVQAEVPHEWQAELEEIARILKVKKLELYRFILGEFLRKVKRERG